MPDACDPVTAYLTVTHDDGTRTVVWMTDWPLALVLLLMAIGVETEVVG